MSDASSVLGFGTSFVGRFEVMADGSYVTTKWIVLGGLPVCPLSCWRHSPWQGLDDAVSHQPYMDEEHKPMFSGESGFRHAENYMSSERLPLQWRYFGKQGLCSLCLVLWVIAAFPVFGRALVLSYAQEAVAFYALLLGYYVILPLALILFIGVFFDRIWGSDSP